MKSILIKKSFDWVLFYDNIWNVKSLKEKKNEAKFSITVIEKGSKHVLQTNWNVQNFKEFCKFLN